MLLDTQRVNPVAKELEPSFCLYLLREGSGSSHERERENDVTGSYYRLIHRQVGHQDDATFPEVVMTLRKLRLRPSLNVRAGP